MAVPAGTFQVYQGIGVREDLSDIIFDISPTQTPFLSNAKRGSAAQPFCEWQTDSLAAASNNTQIEGDDGATTTAVPTVRYGNYVNLSWKVPRVSGTIRASDTAGRADEYDYQVMKRSSELKRDVEFALLGGQGATAGAAASARALAGVGRWIFGKTATNAGNGVMTVTSATTASVASGAPGASVTSVASSSAIVESRLKSAISLAWTDGGDPTLILCNATDKQTISTFSGIATQYRDNPQVGPATLIGSADTYISDFGTHFIVADRFMPTQAGAHAVYVLDMEYWEVAFLRDFQTEPLAKTGDSDRSLVLAEYTLKALNPNASAKIQATG